ncbi:MAG: DUF1194 domain-containing protein [Pseudomonadota bacterium]
MRQGAFAILIAVLLTALLPGASTRTQPARTDLNLLIAIDCSYSVNSAEFQLQSVGIANALRSDEVFAAIQSGRFGRISIAVIQWSGPDTQEIVVPWTLVASRNDAFSIADQVEAAPRLTAEGVTAIGSAITFAIDYHAKAPFFADRQVIDMQADGTSTWSRGVPIRQARNRAVDNGLVVNGLPILNEIPYLHHYFRNHVIGGPGSFIEIAENYRAFETAIKRKLIREIRGMALSRRAHDASVT